MYNKREKTPVYGRFRIQLQRETPPCAPCLSSVFLLGAGACKKYWVCCLLEFPPGNSFYRAPCPCKWQTKSSYECAGNTPAETQIYPRMQNAPRTGVHRPHRHIAFSSESSCLHTVEKHLWVSSRNSLSAGFVLLWRLMDLIMSQNMVLMCAR